MAAHCLCGIKTPLLYARRKTAEPSSKLRELIDGALEDKVLTRAEPQEILNAVTADSEVSPEEHELLELVVERLNSGEIRAVD